MLFLVAGFVYAEEADSHDDGSRTVPVHRVQIKDERGDDIVAGYSLAMPFSAKETCGACHDYKKITSGRHFNDVCPDVEKGKNSQPWVLVDEKTGTCIPVSERGWKGTWKSADLGMSSWDFVKAFGFHMPGSGMGEKVDYSDLEARWEISGKLEANCLACHSASSRQDMGEWAKQIGRENFRWAATAASGIGDVRGMASRLERSWDLLDGFDPDDRSYRVPPHIMYDGDLFRNGKTCFFDIAKTPSDTRCLHCHSVSEANGKPSQVAGDVHCSSGMQCVSCHRNGVDHDIARGAEGDGKGFSCRECHLGSGKGEGVADLGGTYGAPEPKHKGLPEVHLTKLSCTACHSGLWPKDGQTVVRTSRANRLGIYGQAQWDRDLPLIIEPVFVKTEDGKITPCRMMWPAFWAVVEGDKVTPLKADVVMEAGSEFLDAESRVSGVLSSIATLMNEENSYVGISVVYAGGKAYRRDAGGRLELVEEKASLPSEHCGFGYLTTNGYESLIGNLSKAAEGDPLVAAHDRITKILNLISGADKEGVAPPPAFTADGLIYRMGPAEFEEVPKEEVARMRKVEKDAREALDAFCKLHGVVVEKMSVYKDGTSEKLKGSDPLTKEGRDLKQTLTVAENAIGPQALFIFGDKAYRETAKKRLVVEKAPAGLEKGRFFGSFQNGVFTPYATADVLSFLGDIAGRDGVLLEPQVKGVLSKLKDKVNGQAAYISGGMLFTLGAGGELVAAKNEAAEPYHWPVGHDVRPAMQSLGVRGCEDCHDKKSTFLFAQVKGRGPLVTDKVAVASMYEFMGLDRELHELYGGAFKLRQLGVVLSLGVCALLGAIFVLFMLDGLSRLLKIISGRKS